jgi:hypothetical protein
MSPLAETIAGKAAAGLASWAASRAPQLASRAAGRIRADHRTIGVDGFYGHPLRGGWANVVCVVRVAPSRHRSLTQNPSALVAFTEDVSESVFGKKLKIVVARSSDQFVWLEDRNENLQVAPSDLHPRIRVCAHRCGLLEVATAVSLALDGRSTTLRVELESIARGLAAPGMTLPAHAVSFEWKSNQRLDWEAWVSPTVSSPKHGTVRWSVEFGQAPTPSGASEERQPHAGFIGEAKVRGLAIRKTSEKIPDHWLVDWLHSSGYWGVDETVFSICGTLCRDRAGKG